MQLDGNKTYLGLAVAALPFAFDFVFGLIDCLNDQCNRELLKESLVAIGLIFAGVGGAHKLDKIRNSNQIANLPNGIYKKVER